MGLSKKADWERGKPLRDQIKLYEEMIALRDARIAELEQHHLWLADLLAPRPNGLAMVTWVTCRSCGKPWPSAGGILYEGLICPLCRKAKDAAPH
jgi:hypothetical protein